MRRRTKTYLMAPLFLLVAVLVRVEYAILRFVEWVQEGDHLESTLQ